MKRITLSLLATFFVAIVIFTSCSEEKNITGTPAKDEASIVEFNHGIITYNKLPDAYLMPVAVFNNEPIRITGNFRSRNIDVDSSRALVVSDSTHDDIFEIPAWTEGRILDIRHHIDPVTKKVDSAWIDHLLVSYSYKNQVFTVWYTRSDNPANLKPETSVFALNPASEILYKYKDQTTQARFEGTYDNSRLYIKLKTKSGYSQSKQVAEGDKGVGEKPRQQLNAADTSGTKKTVLPPPPVGKQ